MTDSYESHISREKGSIHISNLSRESIIENGAEHMGFDGYFLFEVSDDPSCNGITILGKACSLDAAFHLADAWNTNRVSLIY